MLGSTYSSDMMASNLIANNLLQNNSTFSCQLQQASYHAEDILLGKHSLFGDDLEHNFVPYKRSRFDFPLFNNNHVNNEGVETQESIFDIALPLVNPGLPIHQMDPTFIQAMMIDQGEPSGSSYCTGTFNDQVAPPSFEDNDWISPSNASVTCEIEQPSTVDVTANHQVSSEIYIGEQSLDESYDSTQIIEPTFEPEVEVQTLQVQVPIQVVEASKPRSTTSQVKREIKAHVKSLQSPKSNLARAAAARGGPPRPSQQQQLPGKLKLDQGFKSLLRGIRQAIRDGFSAARLDKGKHHWSEEKWMEKSRTYLEQHLGFKRVTDYEVASVCVLLYHSFGPSKTKLCNPDSVIYQLLGDDGMKLFKCIFDNNNKDMIKDFFSQDLIIKLWPNAILKNLHYETCFNIEEGPNPEIDYTFRVMTNMMINDFALRMPQWWTKRFPQAAALTTV